MRFFLAMILAVAMTAGTAFAGDGPHGKSDCGGGCIVRCPNCCHECVFSADKAKVTKSCYEVECKDICIPRIVFPWQKGCCTCGKGAKDAGDGKDGCCAIHNGAKTKSVRVLKKYEYECSECKHKWTPVPKGDDTVIDKDLAPEPAAAPEPPSLEARNAFGRPIVERVANSN